MTWSLLEQGLTAWCWVGVALRLLLLIVSILAALRSVFLAADPVALISGYSRFYSPFLVCVFNVGGWAFLSLTNGVLLAVL